MSLEARLDRLGLALFAWWVWPAALIGCAAVVLVASWTFVPGPGETVAWLGRAAFPTCPTLAETGLPCGQCGMTRSWVWAARGQPWRAWTYNPAGLALWAWLVAGGALGAARIARRDPALGRWSGRGLALAGALWLALYFAADLARSWGWNPLP